MPGHDIIVIGASAGGVEALTQLMAYLPSDLPAAIFVVLHIPAQGPSVMPQILNRAIKKRQEKLPFQALHPQDGEKIEHGRIYVAPPDRHLLIKDGHVRLARGPRENSHRPAVDPLFRTAARAYGARVIGLILSGTLDDGTAGLLAVKQQGGVAIVQDPEEALYSGMPSSAIENVEVDHILRLSEIASVLEQIANQPVQKSQVKALSEDIEMESDMAQLELGAMNNPNRPGKPSPFACPDCNGVLWEIDGGKQLIRFRCRTGHAFSSGTLLAKQTEAQEDAMWNALRALEEKAALTQRLADRARDRNQSISARRFEEQAQTAYQRATILRQLLLKPDNGDLSTFNGQIVGSQSLLENGDSTGRGGEGESGRVGDFSIRLEKFGGTETDTANFSQNPIPSNPLVKGESKIQNSLTPRPSSLTPSPLHIVAICASAGGVKAISQVLSILPADFPAAIAIVQHISPNHPSAMVEILSSSTKLSVKQAQEGDLLEAGCVYIAPPDQHLLLNPDSTIGLSGSELVNFTRPSADLLFESVAASFKQRAIAIVLSGTGSDGAMGIRAIKQMGGTVIAQEPGSCEFFAMPQAAINTGNVDRILPLNDIAADLISLVTTEETYHP